MIGSFKSCGISNVKKVKIAITAMHNSNLAVPVSFFVFWQTSNVCILGDMQSIYFSVIAIRVDIAFINPTINKSRDYARLLCLQTIRRSHMMRIFIWSREQDLEDALSGEESALDAA